MQFLNAVQNCVNNSRENNRTCGANNLPASQETTALYGARRIVLVLQQSAASPYPTPEQLEPHHPTDFLKISPNLSLRFTSCLIFFRFPNQISLCIFLLPIRATCPAYLILLYILTSVIIVQE